MRKPFSQRYGYYKPTDIIHREELTGEILNSVMNATSDMLNNYSHFQFSNFEQRLTAEFQLKYLNLRYEQMQFARTPFEYIDDEEVEWYHRIDIIEWIIEHLRRYIYEIDVEGKIVKTVVAQLEYVFEKYIDSLNIEFERLNYAYRIIDGIFFETTSSSEVAVIQETLDSADVNSVTHLQECLRLLSPSNQELSTRNAIKEAISAVEVTARQMTGTNTLDDAFKKLRDIHPMIKLSMEKLYHYTNQKDTGIRHGWMEQSDEPTINEAIFVLVTSCSFINYLNKIYCNA